MKQPCCRLESPVNDETSGSSKALTSLHTAVLAFDTDNELLNLKFSDNTTNAANYVAGLVAQLNLIYERDLLVRFLQGYTILRVSTTADPYLVESAGNASSGKLSEVSTYWSANFDGIRRTAVVMLSGKQPTTNSASGIAWVGGLCSGRYGVSFNQVYRSGIVATASDGRLVGHEIGHNFGSGHTHCTDTDVATAGMQPIDYCYPGDCGTSWNPPSDAACPTPFDITTASGTVVTAVQGTLMSYCHHLSGCPRASVFHPLSISLAISADVDAAVGRCIYPVNGNPAPVVSGISPASGSVYGGTPVTIDGGNFLSPATVTFVDLVGAETATSVNVVSGTRITATAPAHTPGLKDVLVQNPEGASGTLRNAFTFLTVPARFYSLSPCRIVDTRNATGALGGPALVPSATRLFGLANTCGVPASARALSVNLTVTGATAPGFLTLYPGSGTLPVASHVNFSTGQTRANNAVVPLSSAGDGVLAVQNGSTGAVHVILDVNGYFE